MRYKLPSTSYFHTYIPAQNRLGVWMVYENATGKIFGRFQTENEADSHARVLNDTWVQEFYETRPASEHAPAPHPYMYRSESLLSQLKSFRVDIALYCRYLFRLR